jgi:NitT/TauT family transport system substrate-binding protein
VKDTDAELYFEALRLAQIAIDIEPERYKHHFLKELPERYHNLVDVWTFGTGERLVFEPYTREMFERTHRWMMNWKFFASERSENLAYDAAVL